MFSLYNLCKHVTPGWDIFFLSQGDNLNKLGRVVIGDATYQISKI